MSSGGPLASGPGAGLPGAPPKETIERMFDSSAGGYDRSGPGVFARMGARLVEKVSLTPGARVLDVATGAGAALLPAARRVGPSGQMTGIDLSQGMLREAQANARAAGLTNVQLLKMDAERLDFPDAAFDAVLCAHGIFLLPDREAALREMARVTKPGGAVGVSIFGDSPPAFMPAWDMLAQQFREYGVQARFPNPLAYLTPEEMTGLLGRAGLGSAQAAGETEDVVFADAQDWWAFLLTMAPRPAILGLDDQTREHFKTDYFERLAHLTRADGLHLPVSVVYGVGRR